MSEYQYYEFIAVEQPLSRADMAELRSRSSRATITATSFVNEYHWGELKANPADWVRRYFDAYLYSSNWGSRQLSLRLPQANYQKAELQQFATKYALTVDATKTHWIINWDSGDSENNGYDEMEDEHGWMGRLLPLRDELLRGDLRSLYLGWLADVSAYEIADEALEPPLPAGLAQLSGAQQTLVDFLQIDPDLLMAAAQASAPLNALQNESDSDNTRAINVYLSKLASEEMHTILSLLLQGKSQQAERQIKAKFLAQQKHRSGNTASANAPRTVARLRALASEAELHRLERAKQERARQETKKRKERVAYLNSLSADLPRSWQAIHHDAERATAAAYDQAQKAIADLADAYTLSADRKAFDTAMQEFMQSHSKRSALVRRLVASGLWRK